MATVAVAPGAELPKHARKVEIRDSGACAEACEADGPAAAAFFFATGIFFGERFVGFLERSEPVIDFLRFRAPRPSNLFTVSAKVEHQTARRCFPFNAGVGISEE